MAELSILIPARNEEYLKNTIFNLLENIEGDTEILVALDGYLPEPRIETNDPRVIFYHNKEAIGQRQSINMLARYATGKYIMKLDAHCAVDKGFDVKLMKDCKYDWTVIPRMYNLDVETWKPKLNKRTDYMYITSPSLKPKDGERENSYKPFRASYYDKFQKEMNREREPMIDDTMACMGPCFFMHRERFWELGGCDEGHGSWGQQGIEVSLKAWLSGGSLKVNKNTWFAHYFRGHIGFPYENKGSDQEKARQYSKDFWLNNRWEKQTRKLSWLINKFNPPGWEEDMQKEQISDLNRQFYHHIHVKRNHPHWKGTPIIKMPTDMFLYHQAIYENKPDYIIDSGTKFGGSALFYQDMLDIAGGKQVISIDKFPVDKVKDPRIHYIEKGSTDKETLQEIRDIVGDGKVMVVLDSDHRRQHVKRELFFYADIVTSGQFMVVEDCYSRLQEWVGPGEAMDWFFKTAKGKQFKKTDYDQQFLIGFTRDGWLQKI